MTYEKKRNFIINTVYFIIITGIFFLALKFGLSWFLPFVMAFGVSMLMRPLAKRISKIFRVNEKVAACFCSAIFYGITLLLIILAGFNLAIELKKLFFELPTIYAREIEPSVFGIMEWMQGVLVSLDPALHTIVDDFTNQISTNLGASISAISVTAITALSGSISKLPSYFIKTLITIIATFFISSDYENITCFILRQFNEKAQSLILEVKSYTISTLAKYAKSYAFIIFVTFSELSVAFLLLRINNPLALAFAISIFDILPVLGVGGILVPWVIISFIQGNYAFGIGMLIVYLMVTVIRQILEPKIIGDQVGLHPVATLIAMFIGANLFGIVGLFLFPISLVILKKLSDAGKIRLFK